MFLPDGSFVPVDGCLMRVAMVALGIVLAVVLL